MNRDGHPYLRPDRMTYLVGMVGLNELVRIHTGKHLHESAAAMKLGLKIITHIKKQIDKLSRKYGMRLILEQSPAETTAYRFARLDLRYYSPGCRTLYPRRCGPGRTVLYQFHTS